LGLFFNQQGVDKDIIATAAQLSFEEVECIIAKIANSYVSLKRLHPG
jgi:hypothetical protein